MEFTKLSEIEFKNYSTTCAGRNFWQTVQMSKLREKKGWKIHYVAIKEDNNILCAAALVSYPAFLKYHTFQALRGFLVDYKNVELVIKFHLGLIDYIKKSHGIRFIMDPYVVHKQRDIKGEIIVNGEDNTQLIQQLKDLGYQHSGFSVGTHEDVSEPRWMFVLPLEGMDEQSVLKNMSTLTKRSIKKTQRSGFYIEELTRDNLSDYKNIITHTSLRRGFTDRPLSYYENMYDALKPEGMIRFLTLHLATEEYEKDLKNELTIEKKKIAQIEQTLAANPDNIKSQNKLKAASEIVNSVEKRIIEVQDIAKKHGNDVILGGGMFILYGDEVIYLTGGAYEEFMSFAAQYRLQWEMISYALAHHYKRYNFYGISGDFAKTASDYGIYEFKKGFSGEVVELIGEFEYKVNPTILGIYNILRKIKHLIRA